MSTACVFLAHPPNVPGLLFFFFFKLTVPSSWPWMGHAFSNFGQRERCLKIGLTLCLSLATLRVIEQVSDEVRKKTTTCKCATSVQKNQFPKQENRPTVQNVKILYNKPGGRIFKSVFSSSDLWSSKSLFFLLSGGKGAAVGFIMDAHTSPSPPHDLGDARGCCVNEGTFV